MFFLSRDYYWNDCQDTSCDLSSPANSIGGSGSGGSRRGRGHSGTALRNTGLLRGWGGERAGRVEGVAAVGCVAVIGASAGALSACSRALRPEASHPVVGSAGIRVAANHHRGRGREADVGTERRRHRVARPILAEHIALSLSRHQASFGTATVALRCAYLPRASIPQVSRAGLQVALF